MLFDSIKIVIEYSRFLMIESNVDTHFVRISENFSGQRIDNFLRFYLKAVPKSVIYRIIRTGKIRVNTKKVNFYYRLQIGDLLRFPSIRKIKTRQISIYSKTEILFLQKLVIYEDNHILVLNKPSGIAVHDGSGLNFNIIDGLRSIFNTKTQFIELVHRLDRDTSGVLLLAKNRMSLMHLQKQWRLQMIQKEYLALVNGLWDIQVTSISAPVLKKTIICCRNITNTNLIRFKSEKIAKTDFKIKEFFDNQVTFLIINPITGYPHQIRIHVQYAHHPIIGDRMYGNYQINTQFAKLGFNRLFLHASKLCFIHPYVNKKISIYAPIDQSFYKCLYFLRTSEHNK